MGQRCVPTASDHQSVSGLGMSAAPPAPSRHLESADCQGGWQDAGGRGSYSNQSTRVTCAAQLSSQPNCARS